MKLFLKAKALAFVSVAVMLTGSAGYAQLADKDAQNAEQMEGLASMAAAANKTCQQGGDGCGKAQQEVEDASRQMIKNIVNSERIGGAGARTGSAQSCPFCAAR